MIRITSDLYDIAQRVKEIDPTYEVFFNPLENRFEVHSNGKLQAISPYDRLDGRLLRYLRRTRRERAVELIAELESENAKIEREREYEAKRRLENGIALCASRL